MKNLKLPFWITRWPNRQIVVFTKKPKYSPSGKIWDVDGGSIRWFTDRECDEFPEVDVGDLRKCFLSFDIILGDEEKRPE